MESHEFRQLLSSIGEAGRNTEGTGGKRPLGIPTVSDRVAQMAVVMLITLLSNLVFMRIPMPTVPIARRMMLLAKLVSVVGSMRGFWTWTSVNSLTP